MVSAISICILALGLSAASSQLIFSDAESSDVPISERRTFKHGKPVKLLPFVKKHKKFARFAPHVFGKPSYTEIPVIHESPIHESPKPIYKVHRYQGIEVKPVSDIVYSTPEQIIETHSVEPPSGDFLPSINSDHHLLPPAVSSVLFYPANDKPVFSAPSIPIYGSLPPPPHKPIYSFVRAPPQPVFTSLPITSIPPPEFSAISIPRPAPPAIAPPAPVFAPLPTSFPSHPLPPPSQPIFTPIPIQSPVLPPLPSPSPAPVFPPIPVKIPAPILPASPSPPPSNVFSSVSVKIPAPVLPSAPTPAPVFSTVSPVPGPAFPSIPVPLPPAQFSALPLPSPGPSFSVFPPPAPALPSFPISATPEPEYPYPPSGTPIPSYISLGNPDIKDSPVQAFETPKYEEVTPSIADDGSKNIHHVFQKIKDWKADKANAAINHLTHYKQKPVIQPSISHAPNKIELPTQVHHYPTLQLPGPNHPLPLAPAPVYLQPQYLPPAKYENFPPNNIESPPLLNSYGAPISHDSYSPHVSHDRLSSAASEEEPAVVPAPSGGKKTQTEQRQTQQFQPQNFQNQFQQQPIPQEHPVYVPESNPTVKEENKTVEDVQPEVGESNPEEAIRYPNHKE